MSNEHQSIKVRLAAVHYLTSSLSPCNGHHELLCTRRFFRVVSRPLPCPVSKMPHCIPRVHKGDSRCYNKSSHSVREAGGHQLSRETILSHITLQIYRKLSALRQPPVSLFLGAQIAWGQMWFTRFSWKWSISKLNIFPLSRYCPKWQTHMYWNSWFLANTATILEPLLVFQGLTAISLRTVHREAWNPSPRSTSKPDGPSWRPIWEINAQRNVQCSIRKGYQWYGYRAN